MVPRDTIETLLRPGGIEGTLLEAVLEQLPAAVMIVEAPSARLLAMSRRARELLGTDGNDDVLRQLVLRRPDGTAVASPEAIPLVRAARDGETIRDEVYEVDLPDGTARLISVSTTPVHDAGGETVAAVAVFDDVTERQRHLRAERQFVANAAHQLRTPLASIVSAVEVLQTGAKELAAERDLFLDHIEREAQRLTRLSRALLIIARAQTEAERPRLEIVALQPLLQEIAAATRPADGVELSVRCPEPLAALTSRDLLEQAVGNLALNAAHYTGSGSILLAGRAAGETVVIEVVDTGRGMTGEERTRVFERFYRGSAAGEGFGLGLSIARQSVEAVGGSLELESAPGRGTTARIRLPLARLVRS